MQALFVSPNITQLASLPDTAPLYCELVKKAQQLSEIAAALSPQPLIDSADFHRFYQERFENPEADATRILELELSRSYGTIPFQRFLTGHRGTGKSTELTRLILRLEDRFEFLRLSAQDELSPASAEPFDLLEVMAIRLVERAKELDLPLSGELLQKLQSWFSETVATEKSETARDVQAEAETGASLPTILSVLKLGLTVKAGAKYSAARTEETKRKRLQRIAELTTLSNDLYAESNRKLYETHHKEWVILVEDLDKDNVPESVLETLFVRYGSIWSDLRVHFLCTIPLWLAFGDKGRGLPFLYRTIVDIPVFDAAHQPHQAGRSILRRILSQRVSDDLFAPDLREQLIQAAGGNLRDMFALITEAANMAQLAGTARIEAPQCHRAINWLRNDYMKRLGSAVAEGSIPYDKKAEKLKEIYEGGSARIVQDPVLYQLLRARVVNEYNDSYWYGLPPMVVDILIQQGRLPAASPGGLEPYPPPQ